MRRSWLPFWPQLLALPGSLSTSGTLPPRGTCPAGPSTRTAVPEKCTARPLNSIQESAHLKGAAQRGLSFLGSFKVAPGFFFFFSAPDVTLERHVVIVRLSTRLYLPWGQRPCLAYCNFPSTHNWIFFFFWIVQIFSFEFVLFTWSFYFEFP